MANKMRAEIRAEPDFAKQTVALKRLQRINKRIALAMYSDPEAWRKRYWTVDED